MNQKIGVFCGSYVPLRPVYKNDAKALGLHLAVANFSLIYGGGSMGLMGHVARSVLDTGGDVFGVPTTQEVSEGGSILPLKDLQVVETIAARKKHIFEVAAGFIALPGGWGTLSEIVDLLCEKQAQLCSKPFVLFNSAGYWDRFLSLMVYMKEEGFLNDTDTELFHLAHTPQEAVSYLKTVV